tara:strand:- start:2476 stop:3270 length:795 start_codon:yes stop_codon:yes gene_type:complete
VKFGLVSEPTQVLPDFYQLVRLQEVSSTSDEAKALAQDCAGEGTIVVADRQLGGRGRHGREWHSPFGNLYLSLILRPGCSASTASQLSFVSALSVGGALSVIIPSVQKVRYKWPNDVLLRGRKLSGILLESNLHDDGMVDWLVVGVGVNVQSHPSDSQVKWPATSLHAEGFKSITAHTMLREFCTAFHRRYMFWRENGFAQLREEWLASNIGLGERVEVSFPMGVVTGILSDVAMDGSIALLDDKGRYHKISSGTLRLLERLDG